MPFQIGYTDSSGHPWIRIRIIGKNGSRDIDALIDTGFTGFLMLPHDDALDLGLSIIGTSEYVLADGSRVTNAIARGRVLMGPATWAASHGASEGLCEALENATDHNESVDGAIVLGGDDPLIGMELVRVLRKSLAIGPDIVALMDDLMLPTSKDVRSLIAEIEDLKRKLTGLNS